MERSGWLAVPGSRGGRAVVEALNADWRQLVEHRPPQVLEWSVRRPELGDRPELADLLDRASAGCDTTLHALLAEAQSGDRLAARTVLQSLLGRLVRMAARDGRASADDYVAAAWCVLVAYPLAARPVRIAANLALDTLKAVHHERDGWGRAESAPWLAGEQLDQLERGIRQRVLDHGVAARLDAAQVIEAGLRLRLLDEPARLLLEGVYLRGLSGAEVARQSASTPGSVRVRCSRALRVLAAHAVELAEAA
ncbi:RNA polymerase sigma factor [uncultured Friedmanniella sp.]|uniref:RNA polymerase sigma factor n=1 Tax=uncultured Friedmanniella sp. TaxID=335381 RepID=UPI0035CB8E85